MSIGSTPDGSGNHRALAGVEVLGEAAVRGESVERAVLAVHRLAEPAGATGAAGLDRVTDHGVALRDDIYVVSRLDDRPGVLVAKSHGKSLGDVLLPHPLDDVVVRLAPARALDLDDHVARARGVRTVDLVDREPLAHVVGVLVESSCLHVTYSPAPFIINVRYDAVSSRCGHPQTRRRRSRPTTRRVNDKLMRNSHDQSS